MDSDFIEHQVMLLNFNQSLKRQSILVGSCRRVCFIYIIVQKPISSAHFKFCTIRAARMPHPRHYHSLLGFHGCSCPNVVSDLRFSFGFVVLVFLGNDIRITMRYLGKFHLDD